MANVGLVPMSGKPYHAGHDGLVRIAVQENDIVHLFVSTTDRDNVSGKAMEMIWREMIEPTLPPNVDITYGGSPVGNAWLVLGKASEDMSQDTFTIYSDPDDASRFPETNIAKYAPNLVGRVRVRGIDRTQTTDISGTKMRELLASGDKPSFVSYLPQELDGDRIWDILTSIKPEPQAKKKQPKKPPLTGEALLRSYVGHVIRG